MFNPQEADEKAYLQEILQKLQAAHTVADEIVTNYLGNIMESKKYIWENAAQFDKAEMAANRVSTQEEIEQGERAIIERQRLAKLILSPYFGRIDFAEAGASASLPVYIGIHGFSDGGYTNNLIYDWRAPISSMFYDFESGPAFYTAPMGAIEGEVTLKRQYQIKNSVLEYMIESDLNIDDDILQRELSQSSDEKMKNIVATIQREQNAIIRNESAKVLVIQGAAGSGKTSIALHRVAFLLYRYKRTLSSNNIMIISPNKVFGSYISNVLPELGEENILEQSGEDIALSLLGRKYKHQTFAQQVERLLQTNDPEEIRRIQTTATVEFVSQLEEYLQYAEEHFFVPHNLDVGPIHATAQQLAKSYAALKRIPVKKRLDKLGADLISHYRRTSDQPLEPSQARLVRESVRKMYLFPDAMELYKNFYTHIGQPELFVMGPKKTLEFCDVFPFIYVKMYYEELGRGYRKIQYLLVDEMQDYTPVQYAVFAKLFDCRMTILGDSNQSVNPYSSTSAERISPFFQGCLCVELCKSYRSTIEISRFAQKIQENKKLIPIERHGREPQVYRCWDESEELEQVQQLIQEYRQEGYATLGIICKSQEQARQWYDRLHQGCPGISLLDFASSEFTNGIIVTSVHMSKGLEFDQVILPQATKENYATPLDRSLLYIACTRAMHRLDLTGEM